MNSLPDSLLLRAAERADPAELEAIRAARQWAPKPGAQSLAWLSPADELFFGGKAGAGKSDLLLGLGLTAHRKTLFLRRQATQLQEITSRIQEILRPGDRWRFSGHGGVLTTRDRRAVEFTGCDNEKDKQKFKGRAHDLKAWDEVVDFPESVYLFVNGWNRTTVPGQRCRVVAASNPPTTAEGEWVVRRWRAWLDPTAGDRAAPGELRWYTTIGGEEVEFASADPVAHEGRTYHPRSRTFIPGEMLDLLKATGYENTLATMPEPLRSIYLKGDFGAARQDDRWQLIPTKWVALAQRRWVELNPARGDLTALGVDVAMEGQDWTVLAPRHGRVVAPLVKRKGKDTPDGQSVVALVIAAGGGVRGVKTNVDSIGVGKSAYDAARMMGLPDVFPVVVSESSHWRDPKVPAIRFANLRAAMMWKVRSLLDPEGDPDTRLALPPDPTLLADLTAPRYELRVSGIAVESKDEIKKRLGRSTDCGDAVALACWERGTAIVTV
jgi:hypothetical protein